MKVLAMVCNVALLAFTCFVLLTEGGSTEIVYNVFALLLLMIPPLTMLVISRSGSGQLKFPEKEQVSGDDMPSGSPVVRLLAIGGNIILLAFACWAIVDQYPHPEEEGVLAYTLLVVLTPILNVAVLIRGGAVFGWPNLPWGRKGFRG